MLLKLLQSRAIKTNDPGFRRYSSTRAKLRWRSAAGSYALSKQAFQSLLYSLQQTKQPEPRWRQQVHGATVHLPIEGHSSQACLGSCMIGMLVKSRLV